MRKAILTSAAVSVILFANAQLKVYTGGKIYMGGTSTTPLSNLSILGAGYSNWTMYAYQPAGSSPTGGFYCLSGTPSGTGTFYGIIGSVPASTAKTYGVQGTSYSATTTSGTAVGVSGSAGNAADGYNYGVVGLLQGSRQGTGIYGASTATQVQIPGTYAAYFYGDIKTTDATPEKPTDAYWTYPSDNRLKKEITDFKDGLNVIRKIHTVNYKHNGIGGFSTTGNNIGILAQEVQQVAPYCIGKSKIIIKDTEKANFSGSIIGSAMSDSTGEDKYVAEVMNFNPNGLFFAMLNSIKELDSIVTDLKKQLEVKKNERSVNDPKENTFEVELVNNHEVILYQNEPNPFDGSTAIRFFIPESTTGIAYVAFYDMYGKEVNKVEVKEKGFGKIDAKTDNLASGVYSYSIIVHDKVLDTKKMIKSK